MRESVQTRSSMSRVRVDFAPRSFPFHRKLFKAIAARDPDAARAQTLTILAIVEEDIKDMSDEHLRRPVRTGHRHPRP